MVLKEIIFKGIFAFCAIISTLAVGMICLFLFRNAIPTIYEVGFIHFIFGMDWYPMEEIFGIFPMIIGSFYVTALAIFIGVPMGVLSAIYLSSFCPKGLKNSSCPLWSF